jgi:3-hydroxyacyl-[acyl-carrier-protein] dehydratase
VTAVTGQPWTSAPPPRAAAPIAAVDVWYRDRGPDELSVTVRVAVRGDEPNLRGHFPGLAIYPGVFVIETLSQAMALTVRTERDPVLRRIDSVRFLAPLLDGDVLTLAVLAAPDGDGWRVTAVGTRRDGSVTARIKARFDRADDHDD